MGNRNKIYEYLSTSDREAPSGREGTSEKEALLEGKEPSHEESTFKLGMNLQGGKETHKGKVLKKRKGNGPSNRETTFKRGRKLRGGKEHSRSFYWQVVESFSPCMTVYNLFYFEKTLPNFSQGNSSLPPPPHSQVKEKGNITINEH